nr:MAG: hypothetical protein [Chemarfal virus 147]
MCFGFPGLQAWHSPPLRCLAVALVSGRAGPTQHPACPATGSVRPSPCGSSTFRGEGYCEAHSADYWCRALPCLWRPPASQQRIGRLAAVRALNLRSVVNCASALPGTPPGDPSSPAC